MIVLKTLVMNVDKVLVLGTRLMCPKLINIYLVMGIVSLFCGILGKINNNQMFFLIGIMFGILLMKIMFLFFFSMTLNAIRKEENMKQIAIWMKALLLSISVMPISGLLLVQINLLSQLFGSR